MNDKFSYFEEVKGEAIGHWYNYRNYLTRSGTIGNSCMSNVPESYFDIYMSNTDICSLVILKSQESEDKIVGRALLWTLQDGKKFMDRIYTIKESDIQLFRDWAKENGWYYKTYNGSSASNNAIAPDGSNVQLDLTVNIRPGKYENYPYLDTLKYWDSNGTLSTKSTKSTYTLESTEGDAYRCEYCNGTGRRTCYECDGDGDWECSRCDGSGKYQDEECPRCDGEGRITCSDCDGSGNIDCYEC